MAVTFVDWDDLARWSHINRELELGVPEPMETYSSSEHLFTDLGIPAGTKGRIKAARPEPKKASGNKSRGDGQKARGEGQKPAETQKKRNRNRRRVYNNGSKPSA